MRAKGKVRSLRNIQQRMLTVGKVQDPKERQLVSAPVRARRRAFVESTLPELRLAFGALV